MHDLTTWTVNDDWPERVPVTAAELDVFDAWFATSSMSYSAPAVDDGLTRNIQLDNGTEY